MLEAADRPPGADTADLLIRILEGRDKASLDQLRAWRDELQPGLDNLKHRDAVQSKSIDLQDAYRARLHQAYLRARERVELIGVDLERRIQAAEAE